MITFVSYITIIEIFTQIDYFCNEIHDKRKQGDQWITAKLEKFVMEIGWCDWSLIFELQHQFNAPTSIKTCKTQPA